MNELELINSKDIIQLVKSYATSSDQFLEQYGVFRDCAETLNHYVQERAIAYAIADKKRTLEVIHGENEVKTLLEEVEAFKLAPLPRTDEQQRLEKTLDSIIKSINFVDPSYTVPSL